MPDVAEECSRWLRCALSDYEAAKVCPRWLRCALGEFKMAEVTDVSRYEWVQGDWGVYEVNEVSPR
jgi:hypothetical protein